MNIVREISRQETQIRLATRAVVHTVDINAKESDSGDQQQ